MVQRRLWGTDPSAWAELAEAVLDTADVGRGTRVLDVGCGSGLTLLLAAGRGAVPSGLDISPGLLGIAGDRLPEADLREGDMAAAGEQAVREVAQGALAQFQDPATGVIILANTFRWVATGRGAAGRGVAACR